MVSTLLAAVLVSVLVDSAAAAPSITSTFLYTENRSLNDAGFSNGHRLILGAFVSDEQGLGNIASVTATQVSGGPPIPLVSFNTGPLFGIVFSTGPAYAGPRRSGRHDIFQKRVFDAAQLHGASRCAQPRADRILSHHRH